MRNRIFLVVLLCILQVVVKAESYPEVIFDNSLVKGSYARSKVNYTGHSWVENVQGNLLVSDSLFFTPGNALSLKYQSADQGDWDVLIRYSRQKVSLSCASRRRIELKIVYSDTAYRYTRSSVDIDSTGQKSIGQRAASGVR